MGWNEEKTLRMLMVTIALAIVFALLSVALILTNLILNEEEDHYSQSFIYFLAITVGTGVGCAWFRLVRKKRVKHHGIIHTLVLLLILIGHREIFELLIDGEIETCFNKYPISMTNIIFYVVQYLLSFHLVVFNKGISTSKRSFRCGLHAFIGASIFFSSILDGFITSHRMARDTGLSDAFSFNAACICILFYGICMWYLLLNPYFDWRKLSRITKSFSKPDERSNMSVEPSGYEITSKISVQPISAKQSAYHMPQQQQQQYTRRSQSRKNYPTKYAAKGQAF